LRFRYLPILKGIGATDEEQTFRDDVMPSKLRPLAMI